MKFHIVRAHEKLDEIAFLYGLNPEEVKNENHHIRNWTSLVPGMKLRIPIISEAVEQSLNDMEPFLEDYYPKLQINDDDYQEVETKNQDLNYYHIAGEEEMTSIPDPIAKEEEPEHIPEKKEDKHHQNNIYQMMPYYYYPRNYINPYQAYQQQLALYYAMTRMNRTRY